jgi:hypothetical protein
MQIRTEELLEVVRSLGRNPSLGPFTTFLEMLFPFAGKSVQIAEQVFFLQRQRRLQQALKKLLVALRKSLTDISFAEDRAQSLMGIGSGGWIAEIGDVGQALVHALHGLQGVHRQVVEDLAVKLKPIEHQGIPVWSGVPSTELFSKRRPSGSVSWHPP